MGRTQGRVRTASFVVLALTLLAGGCAHRKEEQLKEALKARERQVQALTEQQQPAVFFKGDIRYPRVPWKEGLTLAEALATAQYTWNWDPHYITVTREGEVHPVNPRQLLRGQDNPVLEPGDVIEVRH